jgi:hypothetical protein
MKSAFGAEFSNEYIEENLGTLIRAASGDKDALQSVLNTAAEERLKVLSPNLTSSTKSSLESMFDTVISNQNNLNVGDGLDSILNSNA